MGMYESAEKINIDLVSLFNSIPFENFTVKQREEILNIMIRLGVVAKFRCRSNVAYDNFISACFKGVASINHNEVGEGFIIRTAKIESKEYDNQTTEKDN